jgi:SPP1 family predicted phage head-tail adaptor
VLSRRGASDPGRLRLRLTLERATATPDGAGGSKLSWSAVATVPADVTPIGADERAIGEGLADVTRHRIVIRKRSDVSAGDRFTLGDRLFNIRGLADPQEDGRYLVCLCEEKGGA